MKFTRTTRNLIILALSAALLLFGGIATSAEELPESEAIVDSNATGSEVIEGGESDEAADPITPPAKENLFEEIYEAASSVSSELLAVLAFVGSLIVAFAYKKGLIPAGKRGIVALGNVITQLKDTTDDYNEYQEGVLSDFNERIERLEKLLEQFTRSVIEISHNTESIRNTAQERENVKALMSAQVDMLYEIFMTSQLPQYQKDAVNCRINEMKEVIALNEANK